MISSTITIIATATQLEYVYSLVMFYQSSVSVECHYITFTIDVHSDHSGRVARIDMFTQVNYGLSCTKPCDIHSSMTHYKTSVFTGKLLLYMRQILFSLVHS